jgi:hypothetical protein
VGTENEDFAITVSKKHEETYLGAIAKKNT